MNLSYDEQRALRGLLHCIEYQPVEAGSIFANGVSALRALLAADALAQQAQPQTDEDGVDYFVRCIGEPSWSYVSTLRKYEAAHPETIRRVVEEAKARFPEAADVIASMVFFKSLDISREAFLARDRMAQQAPSLEKALATAREIHESALAQQAQPLTDEMIEEAAEPVDYPQRKLDWMDGAKWARDQMAQQPVRGEATCKHGETKRHPLSYAQRRMMATGFSSAEGGWCDGPKPQREATCSNCGKPQSAHQDDGRCHDDNDGGVGLGWYSMKYQKAVPVCGCGDVIAGEGSATAGPWCVNCVYSAQQPDERLRLVRELHAPISASIGYVDEDICSHCSSWSATPVVAVVSYPCPTIAALEGRETHDKR